MNSGISNSNDRSQGILIFVFLFICIRNLVPSNVSIDTYML